MSAATLTYARSAGRPRRLVFDPWVVGAVAALLLIGLVMVASASMGVSDRETGEPFFYFQRQFIYVLLGLVAAAVTVTIPTEAWEKYSIVLLAVAFVLLLLVLVLGTETFDLFGGLRRLRRPPRVTRYAVLATRHAPRRSAAFGSDVLPPQPCSCRNSPPESGSAESRKWRKPGGNRPRGRTSCQN